ncbi:hypothetical protein ACFLY4_01340 [Chloroflexota bacterium]
MTSSSSDQPAPDNSQKFSSRQIILISILGVVFIIVLVASILVLTRPKSTPEQKTPEPIEAIISTQPISTLTPTPSHTPTFRSTFTPKPTRTPTIAPTSTVTPLPTLLPSLTPAFPSEHNDQYNLVNWTPELATQLIDLLEVYPETLSGYARGADNQGYYDAFAYAIFSQQEALLRFDTAPQARDWLWQVAYNLARTSDPAAGEVYANMITQELNSGQVTLDELYRWGLDHTPQVTIDVVQLDTLSDELSSTLVEVSAGDNGSSFFWLIEKPSGYINFPLTSDFNFIHPSEMNHFIVNLLGTNNTVVGIYPDEVYDSFNYVTPRVFSLDLQPPVELSYENISPPAIGPEFNNNWEPIEPGSGEAVLQFEDLIFAACPVTVNHAYSWNGNNLLFMHPTYLIEPDLDLLSYCEVVINHALNVWGLEPTIQLMETLLPNWPPESTTTGGDYPPDALDEWRFRLSLYHGLLGNWAESTDYASTIVSNPASPDSRWITPAAEFLEIYQEQRDIYQACLPYPHCDPALAFQSLTATITPQEFSDLINILENSGVAVSSAGYFDFDNDGESERWVVIRHNPGTSLEFWIMKPNETGISAIFVETIETDAPRLTYLEPISEPPIVKIDPDITFQLVKQGPDQEPVVVFVEQEVIFASDRTGLELDYLEVTLLTGGDPAYVQQELLVLSKSPHFTCSYLLCPRFLYLLGLASELANDELSAVNAYLELWREYIDSPYATMARFKLISNITPVPTFTPTITETLSSTNTSTVTPTLPGTSGTPSPTITETLPGYPPPGILPTSTQPGYPAP